MVRYKIKTGKTPQIKTTVYNDSYGLDSDIVNACDYDSDGILYCGTEQGLFFFDTDRFVKIIAVKGEVKKIYGDNSGRIFAAAGNVIYCIKNKSVLFCQDINEEIIDIEADDTGKVWMITADNLFYLEDKLFVLLSEIEFGCSTAFTACGDRNIYVTCDRALMMLHGKRPRWGSMMRELTKIPESQFKCIASDKFGHIFVGCEDGLHIYDGRSEWIGPDKLYYFPKCPITKIVLGESDKTYIGTEIGLYVVSGANNRYYGVSRYLPDGNVNDIAVSMDEKNIWVATKKGLSHIEFKDMSLAEKEEYYSSVTEYMKREDYVTRREDTINGDPNTGIVGITDNDGLWTAVYVAAMSLKYSVTGDKITLENARKSMMALIKLMTMSSVKGFPARAYRRPGEDCYGDGDIEWHPSYDDRGPLEWKGETSSDELVGHFYASSWYYDLCADEKEKQIIASALKDITDHILTHNYTLCDADGLPTTWAHFGPEELCLDDKWCWEKGINSLELISFLRITEHVTGDKKYSLEAEKLIKNYHYAMNMLTYKMYDFHACHIDDKLGFSIITPLLRYETNPDMLRFIKLSLRRHFEYEKIENNPYFAFVNAFYTNSHSDICAAIETLEEFPIDLIAYSVNNSIRPDIEIDNRGEYYGDGPHAMYGLPASERSMDCMEYDALTLDDKGRNFITSPGSWLLAYWLGRYYEIIE